jgi:hypothetical protein
MASVDHRTTVSYFDIKTQLMPGCTILIVGKRSSGKTIMLYDVLSHMRGWFNFGLALSPTQESRQALARHMPVEFIDKPSVERLDHFVTTVNDFYDDASAEGAPPRSCFLICDDCAYDDRFMRCKTLQEVFLNGRHFRCTCCMVAQYLKKCSPSLRGNSDFVLVAWDPNADIQEMIWKFWFNMMPKAVFREVFEACTENFGFLVMDVRKSATSRDWHDCVFWYRADTARDA